MGGRLKRRDHTMQLSLTTRGTVIISSKLPYSTQAYEASIPMYLLLRLIAWPSRVSKLPPWLQRHVDSVTKSWLKKLISSGHFITLSSGKATPSTYSTISDEQRLNAKSN